VPAAEEMLTLDVNDITRYEAVKAVVKLYERWGKLEKAEVWRRRLPSTRPATSPVELPSPTARHE
jgi:hypothetical protein